MKNTLLVLSLIALMNCGGKNEHADIQLTTVQCGMCKESIETGVKKLEGIVSVEVNLQEKVGHISYKAGVVDLKAIENAISMLGYNANDTKADSAAYSNLSLCCQVGGMH